MMLYGMIEMGWLDLGIGQQDSSFSEVRQDFIDVLK